MKFLILAIALLFPFVSFADGPEEKIWGTQKEEVLAYYFVWGVADPDDRCVRPYTQSLQVCVSDQRTAFNIAKTAVVTSFRVINTNPMAIDEQCSLRLYWGLTTDLNTELGELASIDVGNDIPAMAAVGAIGTVEVNQTLAAGSWWRVQVEERLVCTSGVGWQIYVMGYYQ
jgi:hypothetical protein